MIFHDRSHFSHGFSKSRRDWQIFLQEGLCRFQPGGAIDAHPDVNRLGEHAILMAGLMVISWEYTIYGYG